LSYAPTASSAAGTNFDYSIGLLRSPALRFANRGTRNKIATHWAPRPATFFHRQGSRLSRKSLSRSQSMPSMGCLPLVVLVVSIAAGAFCQTGTAPSRTPSTSVPPVSGVPGSTVPHTRPGNRTSTTHREPCWEVAGISKSAMQQRHLLAQQTRQEVEAVCANASLTAAQKRQRIREIHQQERQQAQGIISPQQEEALRACREERGGGTHVGGGHVGGHGAGPCGTLPGTVHHENESDLSEDPPEK